MGHQDDKQIYISKNVEKYRVKNEVGKRNNMPGWAESGWTSLPLYVGQSGKSF